MPGHHCVVEGRNLYAVTHLALARRQNSRTGILGTQTNDKGSHMAAFFIRGTLDYHPYQWTLFFNNSLVILEYYTYN